MAQRKYYTAIMTLTDIDGESQAALFSVSQAGAAPVISSVTAPATVTGTTANLDAAASSASGSDLTYAWTIAGEPDNAPDPTFSNNGNTSGATTATFSEAGHYRFHVTASNLYGGLSTTSQDVSVDVTQQLWSVDQWPLTAAAAPGHNYQIHATALDQFGNAMVTQPTFTWTSSLSGSPSASVTPGVFNFTVPIDATAGTSDTVHAIADGNSSLPGGNGPDTIISVDANAPTRASAPAAVTSLAATANSDGSVSLAWANPDGTADGFAIEASTDSGATFSPLGTASAGATSYTVPNLSVTGNANYSFRVTAYNAAGATGAVSNTVLTVVPQIAGSQAGGGAGGGGGSGGISGQGAAGVVKQVSQRPLAPTRLASGKIPAPYNKSNAVYLTWTRSASDTSRTPMSYAVYRNVQNSVYLSVRVGATAGNTLLDPTVAPGQTYFYWVETYNTGSKMLSLPSHSAGVSPADGLRVTTDPPAATTAAVTGLRVITADANALGLPKTQQLSWFWSGTGTPTWAIYRSRSSTSLGNRVSAGYVSGNVTFQNGTYTWKDIDPQGAIPYVQYANLRSPANSVPNSEPDLSSGVAYYTVYAVANGLMSAASPRTFAPQIYLRVGLEVAQAGDPRVGQDISNGIYESALYHTAFGAQIHWSAYNDAALEVAAIRATPGPVVLAGISYGGGASVKMTYGDANLPRKVDLLLLLDPVCEDNKTDQTHGNILAMDGLSTQFETGPNLSNSNAHDWWQTYQIEQTYGGGYATGYIHDRADTNLNTEVGNGHVSQVVNGMFYPGVNAEILTRLTPLASQWHV